MFFFLANTFFRVAAALYAAVLPVVAPLDVRDCSDSRGAALRLLSGLFAVVFTLLAARWLAKTTRIGAVVVLSTLLGAAIASVVLKGAAGPFGRAIPLLVVPCWISIVLLTCASRERLIGRDRAPTPRWSLMIAVLVGAALGAASLLIAYPRLHSRLALWGSVLRHDPGNEGAAMFMADVRLREGFVGASTDILRACYASNPQACGCAVGAIHAALVADRPTDADALAEHAERSQSDCTRVDAFNGLRAEALVSSAKVVSGAKLASEVLTKRPDDTHALYAMGLALVASGDIVGARSFAQRAVETGRGVQAQLLLAWIDIELGRLAEARVVLRQVLWSRSAQHAGALRPRADRRSFERISRSARRVLGGACA
ncbi:MAG: hypothetical protein NVS3B20_25430 [Polyangiales bacterium]